MACSSLGVRVRSALPHIRASITNTTLEFLVITVAQNPKPSVTARYIRFPGSPFFTVKPKCKGHKRVKTRFWAGCYLLVGFRVWGSYRGLKYCLY